jgi:hypothetical protein
VKEKTVRVRRQLGASLLALTAAFTGLGLAATPAQAAGSICTAFVQLDPGITGQACVSATAGGATNASAAFRNNSANPVGSIFRLEMWVIIVDGDSADIHLQCGPGQLVQPGQTVTCRTNATRFTTSPRLGSALFFYDLADRRVDTPQLS